MGKLVVLPTVLLSLSAAVADPVSSEGYDLKDLTDTIGSQHSISASLSPYFGAFDNDVTSGGGRWLASGNTASVIWDFGADTPQSVDAYRLMPAWASYYEDARNPKDFELLAKNEDPDSEEGWTVIDSQTNQSMSGSTSGSQWYFYLTEPTNKTAYRYYKFHVSANNGSTSYVGIQEIELFRLYTPDPVFGACTVTKGADGYLLSVRMSANSGTVKALLTSEDGLTSKEISVGEVSEDDEDPVEVALQASALGIDTRKLYRLSLVAANDAGTSEFDFSEILYFGSGVQESDYVWRAQFALSEGIATALGEETLTDVPVLVRLSADIPNFSLAAFSDSARRDLLFRDERGTVLSHEIDSADSEGGLLVWVKVPELTASTVLTCCYGGPVNPQALNAADTWSGYVGVWHLNGHDASNTTADATGHGLDATGADFTGIDGPFGSPAAQTTKAMTAPDFEPVHQVGGTFSCSLWFKKPTQGGEYSTFVSKKTGLNWDASTGWYLEMSQSATTAKFISSGGSAWSMTSVPTVKTNWNHFHVVCNGSTVKVYLNGNMTPALSNSTSVKASSVAFSLLGASQQGDEFRLKKTADSALRASIEYKAMADVDFLSTEGFVPVDATATVFGAPSASVSNEGAVLVTIPVEGGSGDVSVIYNETTEVALGSVTTTPCTFTDTPAVPADTIWSFTAKGVNQKGTVVEKACESGVLNGVVNATATRNADERDLVEGVFTISRPSNSEACTYPLSVNLSWGGTAEAGKNYEDTLPSSVTIPAGAASVTVTVVPMLDSESTEDETLLLTVAPGPYRTGTAAEMTILNLSTPTGFNTWVAKEAGRASDAANWSDGVPGSKETVANRSVLFDGRFSTADCDWDVPTAESAPLASWTQTQGYSGTVTVRTEFPEYPDAAFTCLYIAGDLSSDCGRMTHPQSIYQTSGTPYSLEEMRGMAHYRLRVHVGGNLTLGAEASINANSKGYWRYGTGFNISGSHGGWRNGAADDSLKGNCAPYGNPKEPVDIGSCTCVGTDSAGKAAPGGGAVYVTVGGTATVNGSMTADGNGNSSGGSSAGSVYLRAGTVAGSGSIHANGVKPTSDKEAGAGGRVAVVSDTTVSSGLTLAATSGGAYYSGAGTVFVKDGSMTNGRLIVANTISTQTGASARTPVTGDGDWTFDEIVVGSCGRLTVPNGRTLTLPGGLASVSSSDASSPYDGIWVMRGGRIDMGSGDQVMSGGWTFASTEPFEFPANLSLENGARLGLFRLLQSGTNSTLKCDYTVKGDLSVASGCSIDVSQIYHSSAANAVYPQAAHGGWSTYDNPSKGYPSTSNTFGSVFAPVDFGSTPGKGYYGCGALKLSVSGCLTVEGDISASGSRSDNTADNIPASPGGSIWITAGSIEGSGRISADGACGRYAYAGGAGGGRVSISLTDPSARFPETLRLSAAGSFGYAFNANAEKISSAGTVYLQDGSRGEKRGTIVISNYNKPWSSFTKMISNGKRCPTTPIVARLRADEVKDFKYASVVVTNAAVAEVSVPKLSLSRLEVASEAQVDLAGNVLSVKGAVFGDQKLPPGTYKASSYPEFLLDSTGSDGTLVVAGSGMVLYVR